MMGKRACGDFALNTNVRHLTSSIQREASGCLNIDHQLEFVAAVRQHSLAQCSLTFVCKRLAEPHAPSLSATSRLMQCSKKKPTRPPRRRDPILEVGQ
jgi:hypothetical protein